MNSGDIGNSLPPHQWVPLAAGGLTLAGGLLSAFGSGPDWVWPIVLIIILPLVLLPWALPKFRRIWLVRRQWKDVSVLIPEFDAFVTTLNEWSETSRVTLHNSIAQFIRSNVSSGGQASRPPPPFPFHFLMDRSISILLKQSKRPKEFIEKVSLFEGVLEIYQELYVDEPLQNSFGGHVISEFGDNRRVAELRRQFSEYESFMQDYARWATRLNISVNENVSRHPRFISISPTTYEILGV